MSREVEPLLVRNEKLAKECSRLKSENRSLKTLLRKLLTEDLKISKADSGPEKREVAVQTDVEFPHSQREHLTSIGGGFIIASRTSLRKNSQGNTLTAFKTAVEDLPREKAKSPAIPRSIRMESPVVISPEDENVATSQHKSMRAVDLSTEIEDESSYSSPPTVGNFDTMQTPTRVTSVRRGLGAAWGVGASASNSRSGSGNQTGSITDSYGTPVRTPGSGSRSESTERPQRSVRRLTTYKEPTLHGKIRKNYNDKLYQFILPEDTASK